jgi:hypothetical protein
MAFHAPPDEPDAPLPALPGATVLVPKIGGFPELAKGGRERRRHVSRRGDARSIALDQSKGEWTGTRVSCPPARPTPHPRTARGKARSPFRAVGFFP